MNEPHEGRRHATADMAAAASGRRGEERKRLEGSERATDRPAYPMGAGTIVAEADAAEAECSVLPKYSPTSGRS